MKRAFIFSALALLLSSGPAFAASPDASSSAAVAAPVWRSVYASILSAHGYGSWSVSTSGTALSQTTRGPLHFRTVRSAPNLTTANITARIVFHAGTEAGICGRMDASGDGYCFAVGMNGQGTGIAMFASGDQNPRIVSSGSPFKIKDGQAYDLKLEILGPDMYGKIWPDKTKEPDAWTASAEDQAFSSGLIGFYTSGSSVSIDSIAYGTRAVKSSVSLPPVVSSVSPSSVLAGGSSMLSGKNFTLDSRVLLDGGLVSTLFASSTALHFSTAPDTPVGTHRITVSTSGSLSTTSASLSVIPAHTGPAASLLPHLIPVTLGPDAVAAAFSAIGKFLGRIF